MQSLGKYAPTLKPLHFPRATRLNGAANMRAALKHEKR